ncbi:MAG: alpha-L-fucosidase [Planctomycetes bacterium]|nr:alpha-L-fucosidase [Planctomycetota bacterium]
MRSLLPLFSAAVMAQGPVAVPADSNGDTIVRLASSVRPSPRQVAWQATACNAFVHFGINTFTDREWGDGTESPRDFAPSEFDARQWVETFRAAGMRGLVLTCKHHDGFCLWPTATTTHDVAASPFRGGQGDVVGEVAAACRDGGLGFGIYLSPWDRHEPSFGTKAYQEVFLGQLRELCTNYGPLFEVWFDGAHCPADDPESFDWQLVFRTVRELQPAAVIAITGPDVRWVGNEAGRTRDEEWSVLPLPAAAPGPFEQDRASWRALWALRERNQDQDLGSRRQLAAARALCWWPAETDVSIRPGWFHHPHEDAQVKSAATLVDLWFGAVGQNAVLLLNVPADRRGRIADADVAALRGLGAWLEATFGQDLAGAATRKHYPKAGELLFAQPTTVDVFDLGEDVLAAGQQVEQFRIEVLQNGGWRECARGTTIGMRRLVRSEPVTGDGFRYWLERTRGKAQISHFRVFRRPELLRPPTIRRRDDGTVTISGHGGELHYTLDGSAVTRTSPRYTGPLSLPDGGIVRAAALAAADARALPLTAANESTATFGLCQRGWRVVDCSSEQGGGEGAAKLIDGDPSTHWHSRWSPDSPSPPHHVTIDLGQAVQARGFVYLPRQEGTNGTVADYELLGSVDGERWTSLAAGTFANIAANPVAQVVTLPAPATLRFVRFVAKRECQGRAWASGAELEVLVR